MNGDNESDSSSSSSSSSYESSSSEGLPASGGMVWETDQHGDFITISCSENTAKLYRDRFARGSVGESVLFGGQWMTLNSFQSVSGRQSSKNWKRSIRTNGRCLFEYVMEGVLSEHSKSCVCSLCDGGVLRREGEVAMATKRRRLSQADGQGWSPGNGGGGGVVIPGGGSSNEDEYIPGKRTDSEDTMHRNSIIDISDFIPRRSRRSTGPKQYKGHRTELGTFTRRPIHWDSEEVAEFLRLQGFSEYATPFMQCGIDGQSLFLLKEHHLFERFNMKLGPALCLLDTVGRLKHPPH